MFKCLRDSSIDFSGVFSFWFIFITLHIKIFFWFSWTSEPIYLFLSFYLTSLPISICLRILSLKVSYILNELFKAVALHRLVWLFKMNEFRGVFYRFIIEFLTNYYNFFLGKFIGIPFFVCLYIFLFKSLL
jgi:hypothetical protein